MTCTVEGCEKPVKHRQMCSMHLTRLKRHGSTEPRRGCHGTLAERFERFVVRAPDGCWSWTGTIGKTGYAELPPIRAHRLSYELFVGPIPDGLSVLHRCDNPPCTNPEHLFVGTHADNMADAVRKGRLLGSPSHGHKLTREDAVEIRRLRAEGWTRRQVAERFGIHMDNVTEITSGRMWRTA